MTRLPFAQPVIRASGAPRGGALLIVLATLVLVTTASTILVSAAAEIQMRRRVDVCTRMADDLLRAAEAPIQDWLANDSAKVVLPEDVLEPQVPLLHDLFVAGVHECELTITAWDQCGMVPIELIRKGSQLRTVLPPTVLEQVERVKEFNIREGLDSYLYIGASTRQLTSPFPNPQPAEIMSFGEMAPSTNNAVPPEILHVIAVGGLASTHGQSPYAINVNTAPISLIESILQLGKQGGIDQIIAVRRQGKQVSASRHFGGHMLLDSADPESAIQLVATSSIWSFRIDARVGPVRKSWWAVYTPIRDKERSKSSPNSYQWKCVQRLVISH